MKFPNYFIRLVLIFNFISCNNTEGKKKTTKVPENVTTNLQVDHFNIWVKNPKIAKQRLVDIGFTSIPDSLSRIHVGQGTTGRYFYFLNSYLELIFVNDQNIFEENNKINQDLDFKERANFEKNGASPFGIALKLKNYNADKIPFEKVRYHQDWMHKDAAIYAAKNSKTNLNEPSLFVVYPEIEFDTFKTLLDLHKIPDEYALWREFYKHPNGAKKVTNIIITSVGLNSKTETITAVNTIENITIKNGNTYLIELYFDNNLQGKSFDLRPELPLIINI